MGNFSKLSQPVRSKKLESGSTKGSNPTAQLKDNRPEQAAQLKFAQLANASQTNETIQRAAVEEEEEIQMKAMEGEALQMKAGESPNDASPAPVQRVENNTGLPDQLKSGVENLSGYSLDDVKVHYNSAKPSQLQAHAYAQGTDIHVAPGQEQHLPHEAWHVVQQKQGRVKATRQLKGKVNINDDAGLENEADVMGTRALQMKLTDRKLQAATVVSPVAQRSEETDMLDSRMNHLVQRVLAILRVLMIQGQNWEQVYGDKGKELGKQGFEKAKNTLLGKGDKEGPSLKEKIIKVALKRWWGSLSLEEKADVVGEGLSFSQKFTRGVTGVLDSIRRPSGQQEEDGSKEKSNETDEQRRWFNGLLSAVDTDQLEAVYETYQEYNKAMAKLKEFEGSVEDLAKEVGTKLGGKAGEIKSKKEFESKFEEQQVAYKVARLEFKFLKASITDKTRYQEELDALSDALDVRLQGPSAMINNPGRFTNDQEQMARAVDTCSIAYANLKGTNILRNATTSGFSNIKNWFQSKKDELIGKSSEDQQRTDELQTDLIHEIQTVCNKGWYWHTSGVFATKPAGVTEIGEKLSGNNSTLEKLTAIRQQLTQPEEELAQTETEISSNDKQISDLTSELKREVNGDEVLDKAGSQKGFDDYVEKQGGNSKELVGLGTEKARLALKKRDLKKKIKGDGRKPLTQVFYNAIKDLQPDNLVSLAKTIAVMKQIGAELDETTSHSKGL